MHWSTFRRECSCKFASRGVPQGASYGAHHYLPYNSEHVPGHSSEYCRGKSRQLGYTSQSRKFEIPQTESISQSPVIATDVTLDRIISMYIFLLIFLRLPEQGYGDCHCGMHPSGREVCWKGGLFAPAVGNTPIRGCWHLDRLRRAWEHHFGFTAGQGRTINGIIRCN